MRSAILLLLAALLLPACPFQDLREKPLVTVRVLAKATGEDAAAHDPARIEIARSGPTGRDLEVTLDIGGTASNLPGGDFAGGPLPAAVTVPAGAASVEIVITPFDDVEREGLETVEVAVAPEATYRVGGADRGVAEIVDDDAVVGALTVAEAEALIAARLGEAGFVVLDVRTPAEFSAGHLEGAVNLDFLDAAFPNHAAALDRSATYVVYCQGGFRSGNAVAQMTDLNFAELQDMLGGIAAWAGAGYPVVTD